ncbi:acetyl-CoA carboxylase biotin carboxylase subunit [Brevibacillus laterosporus]|uniref:acetyl-CoA carboxylase biotin carboxylase subunit n=1 Tax=Brevibacillus laterosporus TaxID=1465 RepID=UPI003D1D2B6E
MKKVCIANRGEIARRIIRTCKQMGIATVAVYSDADQEALFVKEADEAIRIGPPPVPQSYLNMEAVLKAAREAGADAIHPGYGLLSENSEFAKQCEQEGLLFIGPSASVIEQMGDKVKARQLMRSAGVPVVPGIEDHLETAEDAVRLAASIGYPLMLKASAGGGGIGMQVCHSDEEMRQAFLSAKGRAKAYFGNDTMFLERYIEQPHHIEVQIVADQKGTTLHLLERECSIQRRHQKVVEESPSPFLDEKTRASVCAMAITAAEAVGYTGAGTVEFIMDGDRNFYFLEMNTRLQVEHPVTEEMIGIDLVEWQLRIARGEALSITQEEVKPKRHAIELRIYAEDPVTFFPSPGTITVYDVPQMESVRIDDAVEAGTIVTPFYDPMIAKLIVSGETREQAVFLAQQAVENYKIEGLKTNLPFLQDVLAQPAFQKGCYDTHFIQQMREPKGV